MTGSHPWSHQGQLDVDVAIVGGGPAGLYCAWRLLDDANFPLKRICVLEAEERFGGRVLTLHMPPLPFRCNMGAMRYLDSHVIVNGLLTKFGLDPYDHDFPLSSYFLRGRHIAPPPHSTDPKLGEWDGKLREYVPGSKAIPQQAYRFKQLEDVPTTWERRRCSEDGRKVEELLKIAIGIALGRVEINNDATACRALQSLAGSSANEKIRELNGKLRAIGNKPDNISFGDFTPDEWEVIKTFGMFQRSASDRPRLLRNMGFWAFVESSLSPEGFAFVRDGFGYPSILETWNAGEHIAWFLADFAGKPKGILGGFEGIVARLREQIEKQSAHVGLAADQVLLEQSVVETIEEASDGRFTLRVSHPENSRYSSTSSTVTASHVVLAVSPGALRRMEIPKGLEPNGMLRNVSLKHSSDIWETVQANPLLKVFAFYKTAWWYDALRENDQEKITEFAGHRCHVNRVKDDRGNLVSNAFIVSKVMTDLPVRQLYLHGPEANEARAEKSGKHDSYGPCTAMIMAYCDTRDVPFWDNLAWEPAKEYFFCDDDLREALLGHELGKDYSSADVVAEYGVQDAFVAQFHHYIRHIFSGVIDEGKIERPLTVVYENWGRAPFYGGWHAWRPNCSPTIIRRGIVQPFVKKKIYVCGEAFSVDQGWVEGALRSTECVLRLLGVKTPPDWIRSDAVGRLGFRSFADYVRW